MESPSLETCAMPSITQGSAEPTTARAHQCNFLLLLLLATSLAPAATARTRARSFKPKRFHLNQSRRSQHHIDTHKYLMRRGRYIRKFTRQRAEVRCLTGCCAQGRQQCVQYRKDKKTKPHMNCSCSVRLLACDGI